MTLITEERAPSAQEYCALRIKAGLSAKSLKAAEIGLHRGYLTSATLEGSYIPMVADKPVSMKSPPEICRPGIRGDVEEVRVTVSYSE